VSANGKQNGNGVVYPALKRVSPLASLASYPNNITVYGQNQDEKILLFVREHRIVLFFSVLAYSVGLLVPFLIQWTAVLMNRYFFNNTFDTAAVFGSRVWLVVVLFWFSYMLKGYFNIFFRWFYNINILTDNRLVDIDLLGIFTVRVEETSILDIEDVKDTQSGLIQSIFDMGDLEIFTASGKTTFSLSNVPKSHKIRDFIMDVVVAKRRQNGND
jgi:hypothetical protein